MWKHEEYLHISTMNNVSLSRFYSDKKHVEILENGITITYKFCFFLRNVIQFAYYEIHAHACNIENISQRLPYNFPIFSFLNEFYQNRLNLSHHS